MKPTIQGCMRVLKACSKPGRQTIMYKHPSTKSVRGMYQIVTTDIHSNEISYLTFNNVRMFKVANKLFNYVINHV